VLAGSGGASRTRQVVNRHPSETRGAYRWLATQHTTIDVGDSGQELFSSVSGNQAVVIKDLS
jgi:hypothetical protein